MELIKKEETHFVLLRLNNSFELQEINTKLFKKFSNNIVHSKSILNIKKNNLEKKFNITINSDSENISVIALPEINKEQFIKYTKLYSFNIDNLKEYEENLSLICFYQIYPAKTKIINYLDYLLQEQTIFWEDYKKSKLTINDKFIQRKFNFNNIRKKINDEKIGELIDKLSSLDKISENKLDSSNNKDVDYLIDLVNSNKNNFIDSSNALKTPNYFYDNFKVNYTNDEVFMIYNTIPTEELKYNFICYMLCSKNHCHLIINNKQILQACSEILTKYAVVFKYILGYSWLSLKIDEGFKRNNVKENDRIVFDIETANLLPIFPKSYDDINQNPYAGVMIHKNLMNLEKNCLSLNMIKNNYQKYYGICDKETFVKRLNLFVNGSNKSGILDCIDWNKFVITGSAMTACGMKHNPLIDLFRQDLSKEISDIEFITYLTNYYKDSDIDLICTDESLYDFMNSTFDVIQKIEQDFKQPVNITKVQTASIIISDDFIQYEMDNLKKLFSKDTDVDLNFIKKNFDNIVLKKYFYDKYYLSWKTEQKTLYSDKIKDNIIHNMYNQPIDYQEFRIYSLYYDVYENDFQPKDSEKYLYVSNFTNFINSTNKNSTNIIDPLDENIDLLEDIDPDFDTISINSKENKNKLVCKLSETIRFKLSGNSIHRPFEIFKSKNKEPFSTIAKFHMGFVRAYWNGKTVKMLPSYISSMMLQLTTDYKYFASVRDPIEIINKYRSRGFGIILNKNEIMHLIYYNGLVLNEGENKWVNMYKVNIKNKNTFENVLGPKNINNDIFKPSKFFEGVADNTFKYVSLETANNFQEAFHEFFPDYLKQFNNLKCIDDTGHVVPLEKEWIKIIYRIINNKESSKNK